MIVIGHAYSVIQMHKHGWLTFKTELTEAP